MNKLKKFIKAFKMNHRAFMIISKEFPHFIFHSIVETVWTSLTPYVSIYLSALLLEELSTTRDQNQLIKLTLLLLISTAVIGIITKLIGLWEDSFYRGAWYKKEHIYTKKLLEMDYIEVSKTSTKEKVDEIYEDANSGGWGLSRAQWKYFQLFNAILTTLGGFALTITLFTSKVDSSMSQFTFLNSPLFVILIIIAILLVTIISPMISSKADSYFGFGRDENNEKRLLTNRLFGFFGYEIFKINNAQDIRLYKQETFSDNLLSDKTSTFGSKGMFAKLGYTRMGPLHALSVIVSILFTGIVYTFVGAKAIAGAFGIGMVTQYVAAISKVSGGISSFISVSGDFINNVPFLEKSFNLLDTPNEMYQGSLTVEKRNDNKYEIEFKNVSFKYPESNEYALKNVNIKFNVGDKYAFVGMNGSGKTTFIKLLCRLYDPTEGEILLNGINIKKYNYLEYLDIFSIVFQDYELLSYKLGENVAGSSKYDKDKVLDSLEKAGFGDRINSLPNGLDTYLYKDYDTSGVDLSGGEAQKIALARAIYKEAPFTILDEPTAALDPIAEAEVYSRFDEIARDTTTIYISHRLSSCRFCNQIIVFDKGEIIQMGKHDELVKDKNGKYYELWNAQAQYYS